jgi:hypothetical protein
LPLGLLSVAPLFAHVVSVSSGELRVDGTHATYELHIPMYEVTHVANPETALLDHVRFTGARRTSSDCRQDDDSYVCTAHYEFAHAPDAVDVECTLFQITVPNHVHLLHSVAGSNSDQVVFDQTTPRLEVRFRPMSRIESLTRALNEGMWRAIASPAALFLIAIGIAARSRQEAFLLAIMYLCGEWLMRPIAPRIPSALAPRFIEAAMALTVVYLAVEILTLPNAAKRWMVVLILGLFHGLYFAPFPATYLTGATLIQAVAIGILASVALRWLTKKSRSLAAMLLLVSGAIWFVIRFVKS